MRSTWGEVVLWSKVYKVESLKVKNLGNLQGYAGQWRGSGRVSRGSSGELRGHSRVLQRKALIFKAVLKLKIYSPEGRHKTAVGAAHRKLPETNRALHGRHNGCQLRVQRSHVDLNV